MHHRFWPLLFCAPLLLLAACKTAGPPFTPNSSASDTAFTSVELANKVDPSSLLAPTNFYTLGPGDILQIQLAGELETRSRTIVGPDGKIYYSLLPGQMVWGQTLSEAATAIEERMARFVKNQPEVDVTLELGASKNIWILGEVRTPGVYHLTKPLTVLSAVAQVQGFTSPDLVDFRHSFIMRRGEPLSLDLEALFQKGDLAQNIYLQPDDFVYFKKGALKEIYTMGAIAAPGAQSYFPSSSLVSVITAAGGPVQYAHLNKVAIIRGSISQPTIAVVDLKNILAGNLPDIHLKAGDIVYVPFGPFTKLERLADQILIQFVRTIAVNEGRNAVSKNAAPTTLSVPFSQ